MKYLLLVTTLFSGLAFAGSQDKSDTIRSVVQQATSPEFNVDAEAAMARDGVIRPEMVKQANSANESKMMGCLVGCMQSIPEKVQIIVIPESSQITSTISDPARRTISTVGGCGFGVPSTPAQPVNRPAK